MLMNLVGLSPVFHSHSGTGTALFSPRSKILRLRAEMPCSCTALAMKTQVENLMSVRGNSLQL